jgi:phenylpropionate dioxygenase-like ring-hydroxylating dioxygenase large terminal subunit
MRTRAGAGQLVDNFLDAAHFPFVHAASFGVADGEPLESGEVVTGGLPSRHCSSRPTVTAVPSSPTG